MAHQRLTGVVRIAALLAVLASPAHARSAKQAAEPPKAAAETTKPAEAKPVTRATLSGKPVVVDGDSVIIGGVEWRLQGFDTPEIDAAGCEGERRTALLAKRRLEELVAAARRLETATAGEVDRHKRPLGDLLVDGRNVRDILIAEGYARPYNGGKRKGWCSRDSLDNLVPGLAPARDRKGSKP